MPYIHFTEAQKQQANEEDSLLPIFFKKNVETLRNPQKH